MKITIENKILIPFVMLFFLSQVILLVTSFRNDYQLIINNQYRNMDVSVQQLIRYLDYSFENNEMDYDNLPEVISKIKNIMESRIIVENHEETLLNESNYVIDLESLEQVNINNGVTHLINTDYLLSQYYYAPLDWSITIIEDKNALLSYFYESYKYNILTGIIFLTLSLQITVFIAANITNPIKKLVKFCSTIGEGNNERILLNRKDEIGQLNSAFNKMLDQLEISKNELLVVKNYNQNVLNSIEKGIVTFDKMGRRISSNPHANDLIEDYREYYCSDCTVETMIKQRIQKITENDFAEYEQFEFTNRNKTDVRFLDCYISVMHDDNMGVQGYICSFNDVTHRKKIEERMQRSDRLATAGRLASGVAHEIRNPLTGMRTSMQVLKKRLGQDLEEKNTVIIDRTIREIDRINHLISDLLGYSKPTLHAPKSVLVGESIRSVISLLENDIKKRNVNIHIEHDENENNKIRFYIDPNHLHQILLNLVKNALDAVPAEGTILIDFQKNELDGRGEINITDNGVGLAPDNIGKIFDPFFTLKNEGTGLGLSVVHELVGRNHGDINISSSLGKGTVVTCEFDLGGLEHE